MRGCDGGDALTVGKSGMKLPRSYELGAPDSGSTGTGRDLYLGSRCPSAALRHDLRDCRLEDGDSQSYHGDDCG